MSFVFRFREDLVAVLWEPAGAPRCNFRNCRNDLPASAGRDTRTLMPSPCESRHQGDEKSLQKPQGFLPRILFPLDPFLLRVREIHNCTSTIANVKNSERTFLKNRNCM